MGSSKNRFGIGVFKKLFIDSVEIVGGVLLSGSQKVDLDGVAGGLILDADADTHIGANTDDVVVFTVANAADFHMLANIFRALSGSSIETNTINETTAASGVTIDGVLLKDGIATARTPHVEVTADGAITVPSGDTVYMITEDVDGAAMTLVDPTTVTHDGLRLTFISTTARAHTLDLVTGINGGAADVGTFGGAAGDRVSIVAYGGVWYEDGVNVNVTWA